MYLIQKGSHSEFGEYDNFSTTQASTANGTSCQHASAIQTLAI